MKQKIIIIQRKFSNKIKKELLCIKNIKKVEIVNNIAKITYLKKIDEANVIDTINKLCYFTKKNYMSEDIKDIDSDMKLKKFIFILVSILLLIFFIKKIFWYNIFYMITNNIKVIDDEKYFEVRQ